MEEEEDEEEEVEEEEVEEGEASARKQKTKQWPAGSMAPRNAGKTSWFQHDGTCDDS